MLRLDNRMQMLTAVRIADSPAIGIDRIRHDGPQIAAGFTVFGT
jgi:hypothetical protein